MLRRQEHDSPHPLLAFKQPGASPTLGLRLFTSSARKTGLFGEVLHELGGRMASVSAPTRAAGARGVPKGGAGGIHLPELQGVALSWVQ